MKTLKTLASWTPEALMTAGAVSVSYGAGLMYAPAGWLVAGVLLIVAGYVAAKGWK